MTIPPCHCSPLPAATFALLLSALTSCEAGKLSEAHGPNRLIVTKQVFENMDYKRGLDGFTGSIDFDAETDSIGLTYERFISASSSMLFGIQRRDYAIDEPNGDSGDGLELLWDGRIYGRTEEALQPFFGGGIRVGEGVEFEGGLDSHTTIGVQFGAGGAYFHPAGFTAEVGVQFEYTSIRTDLPNSFTVEDKVQGLAGWVSVGWAF